MDLTNDQAQALFDAGCFLVLTGLPEGSEVGLDGTYHTIRRFSGFKFVPPGLHLLAWSTAVSSSSASKTGPAGIPLRHGFLVELQPRQRAVLTYDPASESVAYDGDSGGGGTAISDDHLKTLDKELAPYPFAGLTQWKAVTGHIDETTLRGVLGEERMLSGMTPAIGEEAEKGDESLAGSEEKGMCFVHYRLKKSWRDGAVGEEITRYAQDKSWLFGQVVKEQLESEPLRLLGQLQLAFALLVHLSSYGALVAYKRLLPLLTRSSSFWASPSQYLPNIQATRPLLAALVAALSAQLQVIPDGSFETELPELDLFFLDEIDALRQSIIAAGVGAGIESEWKGLQQAGKKWAWDLEGLDRRPNDPEDDESDEEGEYAPQVVEL